MDFAPAIGIELNLRIETMRQETMPPRVLYRVLHDKELYGHARQIVIDKGVPLPEVFQLKPVHFTPLTRNLQLLWKEINPLLTGREWRKILGCHRAFTNNNGYDCAEKKHGPFADYVNNMNIAMHKPKIESIICGGATVSGVEAVERGERVLWLDTIRPDAVPDANDVPRWQRFEAISVRPDGGTQSFSITPHPEYVPLIASQPVYIELSKVTRL